MGLTPSLIDVVVALGPRDRLVGVTQNDEAPELAHLSRIGGYVDRTAGGAEYGWSRIGLAAADGRGRWGTPVATIGGGWVLPIWRGLYLNPWAAGHAPLDDHRVTVGAERYRPPAFEAAVSLEVGWGARASRTPG